MYSYFIVSNENSRDSKGLPIFLRDLNSRPDAEQLIKFKSGHIMYLKDVDKISEIYVCDFKEKQHGKTLAKDPKRRKDNFKNSLHMYEKKGSIKKLEQGTKFKEGKQFLKYEVKDPDLWNLLQVSYSVQRNARFVIRKLCCLFPFRFTCSIILVIILTSFLPSMTEVNLTF